MCVTCACVCARSKSILEEYCEISSLLTEEIVKAHQEISAAVEQIDPLAEYQHFIDAYRSEGGRSRHSNRVCAFAAVVTVSPPSGLRRLRRRAWSLTPLYWTRRTTCRPMRSSGTR